MLTDHYDRNPEKQLLRGRIGYIKSWILQDGEDSDWHGNIRCLRLPPKVIFVQFFEKVRIGAKTIEKPCDWQIDGIADPGEYPICPWARFWGAGPTSRGSEALD